MAAITRSRGGITPRLSRYFMLFFSTTAITAEYSNIVNIAATIDTGQDGVMFVYVGFACDPFFVNTLG
ncbi:MAG: hypothetical protein K6T83_17510 [Alicyclobacillus sp.]|nr:hypothetical protein [Alicyclobacillus sp.]